MNNLPARQKRERYGLTPTNCRTFSLFAPYFLPVSAVLSIFRYRSLIVKGSCIWKLPPKTSF